MKVIKLPRQSQYPKEIFFGAETYKIRFKKNFHCYGETNANTKTITIKWGLTERQLLATLVHELLHVAEFEAPIKIKHKQLYKWEKAIVELLLDNFL